MNEMKDIITSQLQQLQTHMHRMMFSQYRKPHNPHRGQGRVLAILKLKPEMSQKELTYLLNMSKQSVAELVAKLEKSGYITREPSRDDKRVMTIRLTEEGAKAIEDTDEREPDISKILDCLNDEEQSAFSDYLGRIIGQCEELRPDEDFEAHRKYVEQFMSSVERDRENWPYPDFDCGGRTRGFDHSRGRAHGCERPGERAHGCERPGERHGCEHPGERHGCERPGERHGCEHHGEHAHGCGPFRGRGHGPSGMERPPFGNGGIEHEFDTEENGE